MKTDMRLRHTINLKLLEFQIWTVKARFLWKAGPTLLTQAKQVMDVMAKIPPGRN
jgi:hypothetical protein